MAAKAGILATWLSSAQARDIELTRAATEYLERTRRRVAELARVGDEQAAAHGLTVLKGRRIAAHMPGWMLRQSGDVDLVAPGEEALWACVLDLSARYDAVPQGVSVMDGEFGRHVCVAMKWPAEEPHLDKPMGADIATCAFSGDLKGVPVRTVPPEHDDLCGLFAVAEERFQRKFRIKDLLDFAVLAELAERRLGDALVGVVLEHVEALALAPELRALIRKADPWSPVSPRWRATLDELGPAAKAEKARRRPGRAGVARLRFGFPLDTVPSREPRVTVHRGPRADVATTPIGACLLVADPVLTEDVVAEALGHARTLEAEGGESHAAHRDR
ncbi:hypothetical protein ACIBEJ_08045 [Nonomuraea sp. NPDC050790]|uniref:hypothetical protein n=1 Tax=Nonomuraea sp. NPDC050790 TaxID=3364371 RepID=UPI003798CDA6